jgi:hypothetical protein
LSEDSTFILRFSPEDGSAGAAEQQRGQQQQGFSISSAGVGKSLANFSQKTPFEYGEEEGEAR